MTKLWHLNDTTLCETGMTLTSTQSMTSIMDLKFEREIPWEWHLNDTGVTLEWHRCDTWITQVWHLNDTWMTILYVKLAWYWHQPNTWHDNHTCMTPIVLHLQGCAVTLLWHWCDIGVILVWYCCDISMKLCHLYDTGCDNGMILAWHWPDHLHYTKKTGVWHLLYEITAKVPLTWHWVWHWACDSGDNTMYGIR